MILKQFNALKAFLATPKNLVIVGHRNPDGDAMGATLALSHYLEKKGHKRFTKKFLHPYTTCPILLLCEDNYLSHTCF